MLHRVLLPCLCTFALVSPAVAQDPQVAPGSPAGTEYQLPVERAREQARSGTTGSGDAASGTTPLFGAGVGDEKATGAGGTTGADKQDDDRDRATTTTGERDSGTNAKQTVRAQAAAPDDAGAVLLVIAGGAGGVLLLGGIAGLVCRRRMLRR